MNQILGFFFFGCMVFFGFSQENLSSSFIDINYFKGNIPLHNPDILHLIKGHPEGVILGWNRPNKWKKGVAAAL